jgi:hypothetical protein
MVNRNGNTMVTQESNTQQVVEGIIPYFSFDDKKTKYLSYRATGFTIREARKLTGLKWDRTIRDWRKADPLFAYWDGEGLLRLQEEVGDRFLLSEFSRNFRLVLEKDYRVIHRSMTAENEGGQLSDQDEAYLLKIRSFYTPQQLQAIKQVLTKQAGGDEDFDFNTFVKNMQVNIHYGSEKS